MGIEGERLGLDEIVSSRGKGRHERTGAEDWTHTCAAE